MNIVQSLQWICISIVSLSLLDAQPQINLYYTNSLFQSDKSVMISQHDCLRVTHPHPHRNGASVARELATFCLSEPSRHFPIEKNDWFAKMTFNELREQNITSDQLYRWSAPIDSTEDYQFYLNQVSSSNDLSLGERWFYNCTLPRFGPMCQYQFDYHHPNHTSLEHIIRDFYFYYSYMPTDLTCYEHLSCQRESYFGCLDWTDICDGHIQCVDSGLDEDNCWQLEINECKANEYRCADGQCISIFPSTNEPVDAYCLDGPSEAKLGLEDRSGCFDSQPLMACEERRCSFWIITGSCMYQRVLLILKKLFFPKDENTSESCWLAIVCTLMLPDWDCRHFCEGKHCFTIIERECPYVVYMPTFPMLFGNVYLTFVNNRSISYVDSNNWHVHMCFNNSLYHHYSDRHSVKLSLDGLSCYQYSWWHAAGILDAKERQRRLFGFGNQRIFELNPFRNLSSSICQRSTTYQCQNSFRCISIHRLIDNFVDCPNADDEDADVLANVLLTEEFHRNRFKCPISNRSIPLPYVDENGCNCRRSTEDPCDLEVIRANDVNKTILFKEMCDKVNNLKPINIQGRNETDESACEHWPCDNVYTRCNGKWHCGKGEDELGCDPFSRENCSSTAHLCVSLHARQLICLPIKQVNDGNIDCLGAIDERNLCDEFPIRQSYMTKDFYCDADHPTACIPAFRICDGIQHCTDGKDESFCGKGPFSALGITKEMCKRPYSSKNSSITQVICENIGVEQRLLAEEFTLNQLGSSDAYPTDQSSHIIELPSEFIWTPDADFSFCHRGLRVRVWLDSKTNRSIWTCFCPPNYYGHRCQYQNQRISLTLQIRGSINTWQTAFTILVMLISDDTNGNGERIIHSVEQFTYLFIRDCQTTFSMYLLYGSRPKDQTHRYAVQINIYEKASSNYRGSFLLPVQFNFLPVHRLAYVIDIPRYSTEVKYCSNLRCIHGKCVRYVNAAESSFCQCTAGWTGRYCTIPYDSRCSFDSLAIGVTAHNQSICVCPLYRFGSRCLLVDGICQFGTNGTCANGGQCITPDEFAIFTQKPVCLCSQRFRGERCEIVNNQITLSFDKNIVVPQSFFIHFIAVFKDSSPSRATTFKTMPINQEFVTIYPSQPFHLAFVELARKHYYLIAMQQIYNRSYSTSKIISSSDHCPHIGQIFNESFAQTHLLHRIKFYHLPCEQNSSVLNCFHDDIHLCICYDHARRRLANCFKFDHEIKYDCSGQNHCQNDGQCFQDTMACSRRTICICPQCFYGSYCQFSTNGYGLSLDAILGFHITPHLTLFKQAFIVRTSLALTVVLICAGLIDGVIALITFHNKVVCEVGCGLYLLGSSIATLLTMILFGVKFVILLLAQMSVLRNRSFLSVQCYSIDVALRICLYMNQWLHAWVGIERAVTVMKGTGFSKKKSKSIAKLAVPILLLVTIVTNIHDPIHRHLIDAKQNDDDDETRTWCIVTYSAKLQTYNYAVHFLHFLIPFLCNLVSSVIIITKKSQRQLNVQAHQTFQKLLQHQFFEHKRLFLGPVVLVILAIPRLVISFTSKCMASMNESSLFLIIYFISFIPPILTSLIFIIPSKFYKSQLQLTVKRYRTNIQRRLQLST